jgi:hypothetical protein
MSNMTLNYSTFSSIIRNVSDEEALSVLKKLLKDYEAEGESGLRKLVQALMGGDPKGYLLKLADVSNFQLARYGVLERAGRLLNERK